MNDIRKDKAFRPLLWPTCILGGIVGAFIGFSNPGQDAGPGTIFFSMLLGAGVMIFFGIFGVGLYGGVLYDIWDWISHRGHASKLGDPRATRVMSELSDARATLAKMNSDAARSNGELNAIITIEFNESDPDESKAMTQRIEDFLSKRFDSSDAELCLSAINENDPLKAVRDAIDVYRTDSAERVAKSKLSSELRKVMLDQIGEELSNVQNELAAAKHNQRRVVTLAKQSMPRTHELDV
jgi:hypothetical protein